MVERPVTQYAQSDDLFIAYQITGTGPPDLIFINPTFSHLEMDWESPGGNPTTTRLSAFARVIRFDRRGTGLSDRTSELPTLEQEVQDLVAVLDAASSERPYFWGIGQAGSLCLVFAAMFPERCSGVLAWATPARVLKAPDYPFGWDEETFDWWTRSIEDGTLSLDTTALLAPSKADDAEYSRFHDRYIAAAVNPGAAARALRAQARTDIRDVLPAVQVPVLVLHRGGGDMFPAAQSKDLADRIPGARFMELPGQDWNPDTEDLGRVIDEVQTFITGVRPVPIFDRVLSTVLFTDIVNSTGQLAEVGDLRWREILEEHDQTATSEIERFRGRRVKSTGDGLVATFDGPARAIRCAQAISERVRPQGIEIRAGLHTGEIELRDADIAGLAVHIAARVSSLAGANEVLVSRTVVDLVSGSGIEFEDRGPHELKGAPGSWQILAVAN